MHRGSSSLALPLHAAKSGVARLARHGRGRAIGPFPLPLPRLRGHRGTQSAEGTLKYSTPDSSWSAVKPSDLREPFCRP